MSDPVIPENVRKQLEELEDIFKAYNTPPPPGLIRQDVEDQLYEQLTRPMPTFFGTVHVPLSPPTRRQRLRRALFTTKWRIHDRLFPDCRNNEGSDW